MTPAITVRICKIFRAFEQFCWLCEACEKLYKQKGYDIERRKVIAQNCDRCGKGQPQ